MADYTYIRMTRAQLEEWAASHEIYWNVEPDCEGDPDQALLAGLINAWDTEHDRKSPMPEDEFVVMAYYDFENMGYHKT